MSIKVFIVIIFLIFGVGGCATVDQHAGLSGPLTQRKGIYHKVSEGETLWRIAQVYHIDLDEIIRSNNIPNVAQIEKNQLIFLPGVEKIKQVSSFSRNLDDTGFEWPIKGDIVHYFGERRGPTTNRGIGISSIEGQTVYASRIGKVVFADYLNGYGYTVILDHTGGYSSIYSHNASLLVKVGEHISKRQPIAKLGQFGELAFLHFEIRRKSVADNPLFYLPRL